MIMQLKSADNYTTSGGSENIALKNIRQLKSADNYTGSVSSEDTSQKNIRDFLGKISARGFDESKFDQLVKDLVRYDLEFKLQSARPGFFISGYQEPQKALEKSNQLVRDGRGFVSKALSITQDRLVDLFRGEDEEVIPTEYAFITAWKLVSSASNFLKNDFPKASSATDDEGGIRLRWRNANLTRDVRLYCPGHPERAMYIYHQVGNEYEGVYDVTGLTLAKWLHWLVKGK